MNRLLLLAAALCVVIALVCADERHIDEFLPGEAGAAEDDWAFPSPRSYDTATPATEELDRSLVRGKLDALVSDVETFIAEHERMPDGLGELAPAGDVEDGTALIPEGMWRVPKDPWNSAYVLRDLGDGTFEVRSLGSDGELDTDDDLVSFGDTDPG